MWRRWLSLAIVGVGALAVVNGGWWDAVNSRWFMVAGLGVAGVVTVNLIRLSLQEGPVPVRFVVGAIVTWVFIAHVIGIAMFSLLAIDGCPNVELARGSSAGCEQNIGTVWQVQMVAQAIIVCLTLLWSAPGVALRQRVAALICGAVAAPLALAAYLIAVEARWPEAS
jgi:hypothetical protein